MSLWASVDCEEPFWCFRAAKMKTVMGTVSFTVAEALCFREALSWLKFCSLHFVRKPANQAAHTVARAAISEPGENEWVDEVLHS
ncbi:hypothetical protein GH714_001354 [Hevea brasiliensis]|uniref:RNase H type-1 domain-containing protein n=1 Tax=Hevea brasiliensis TaxID=3981 RepID=A0A6A6MAJ6_HEVBR|nr:hypothetical protein GH714_001354 [Hevea brasiliensis]